MAKMLGHYAFMLGITIAIIAGALAGLKNFPYTALLLVVLGLVTGYMNIGRKERTEFLIATVAMLMLGTSSLAALLSFSNVVPLIAVGKIVESIFANFIAFVSAAAFVIAVEAIWDIEA